MKRSLMMGTSHISHWLRQLSGNPPRLIFSLVRNEIASGPDDGSSRLHNSSRNKHPSFQFSSTYQAGTCDALLVRKPSQLDYTCGRWRHASNRNSSQSLYRYRSFAPKPDQFLTDPHSI